MSVVSLEWGFLMTQSGPFARSDAPGWRFTNVRPDWKGALAGKQKQGVKAGVQSYHSHSATSFHSDCRRLRRIKSTSGLNLSIEDDGMSLPSPFSS